MRTRDIHKLNPLVKGINKSPKMSKEVKNTRNGFKNRILNLTEKPFSEFGTKVLDILKMKNTTIAEETSIKVGQILGVPTNKLWEMVEKDRIDSRVEKMLTPFGIKTNGKADDYNYALAA